MGMYDYVNFKAKCPNCGEEVSGFQSKDGPCILAVIEPDTVTNFYSACDKCLTWVEYTREPKQAESRGTPLTEEQVLALGFVRKVGVRLL